MNAERFGCGMQVRWAFVPIFIMSPVVGMHQLLLLHLSNSGFIMWTEIHEYVQHMSGSELRFQATNPVRSNPRRCVKERKSCGVRL